MPIFPTVPPTLLCVLRDELHLSTWLLVGACLQAIPFLFLSPQSAFLPATALLGFRATRTLLMAGGLIHDSTKDHVIKGRVTAQPPQHTSFDSEKGIDEDFVVFIIGARFTHPFSRFGPGVLTAADYFASMWKEAEADPAKSGYLGRSSDMLATDDGAGNAIITLSYWRSMAHLHEFARSPAHRAGWDWYNKMTKTHPHLGMMHEVYAMPRGKWENVYKNFTPFGMGQTKFPVPAEGKDPKKDFVDPLVSASGPRWSSMKSRMGWAEDLEN